MTGPGTRWLSERRTRDTLDLAGPLGRPFPLPRDPVNALLVLGAIGFQAHGAWRKVRAIG